MERRQRSPCFGAFEIEKISWRDIIAVRSYLSFGAQRGAA
jgi:hypothetical protein